MKVILTGMPKTGTKTMCSALRILGFTVYDFEEQFWFLGREFLKLMNEGGSSEEIREMLKGVDAVTDMPACTLWEEIFKAFPEAKLIHMERDEDAWAASWEKQLDAIRGNMMSRIVTPLTPTGNRLRNYTLAAARNAFSTQTFYPFKAPSYNIPFCRLRYREHNSHVKSVAPKDQVIFFKHSDGWGPLCAFLGVPVPSVPYPHRNKGGEIIDEYVQESEMFKQIKKELVIVVSLVALLIAVFCFYY